MIYCFFSIFLTNVLKKSLVIFFKNSFGDYYEDNKQNFMNNQENIKADNDLDKVLSKAGDNITIQTTRQGNIIQIENNVKKEDLVDIPEFLIRYSSTFFGAASKNEMAINKVGVSPIF